MTFPGQQQNPAAGSFAWFDNMSTQRNQAMASGSGGGGVLIGAALPFMKVTGNAHGDTPFAFAILPSYEGIQAGNPNMGNPMPCMELIIRPAKTSLVRVHPRTKLDGITPFSMDDPWEEALDVHLGQARYAKSKDLKNQAGGEAIVSFRQALSPIRCHVMQVLPYDPVTAQPLSHDPHLWIPSISRWTENGWASRIQELVQVYGISPVDPFNGVILKGRKTGQGIHTKYLADIPLFFGNPPRGYPLLWTPQGAADTQALQQVLARVLPAANAIPVATTEELAEWADQAARVYLGVSRSSQQMGQPNPFGSGFQGAPMATPTASPMGYPGSPGAMPQMGGPMPMAAPPAAPGMPQSPAPAPMGQFMGAAPMAAPAQVPHPAPMGWPGAAGAVPAPAAPPLAGPPGQPGGSAFSPPSFMGKPQVPAPGAAPTPAPSGQFQPPPPMFGGEVRQSTPVAPVAPPLPRAP